MIILSKLKYGDRNSDVEELQKLLNKKLLPNPKLVEDGEFGTNTYKAVIKFQRSAGLTTNGIVGPWTWVRLYFRRVPNSASGSRMPLPRRAPGRRSPNSPSTPTKGVPKSSSGAAPWMAYVKKEMDSGVKRISPGDDPQILEYFKATNYHSKVDEEAWCSAFVNWIMREAGYTKTNDARAKSWKAWGKPLEEPREGAITIVYDPKHGPRVSGYHVSFFVSQTSTHIYLMGGNQTLRVKDKSGKLIKKVKSTISISGYPKSRYDIFYRWPSEKDKLK